MPALSDSRVRSLVEALRDVLITYKLMAAKLPDEQCGMATKIADSAQEILEIAEGPLPKLLELNDRKRELLLETLVRVEFSSAGGFTQDHARLLMGFCLESPSFHHHVSQVTSDDHYQRLAMQYAEVSGVELPERRKAKAA